MFVVYSLNQEIMLLAKFISKHVDPSGPPIDIHLRNNKPNRVKTFSTSVWGILPVYIFFSLFLSLFLVMAIEGNYQPVN